jgi:translocation and assembly module TamA
LIPSFFLTRTESDDPLRPTKGYQFSFSLRGADKHVTHGNHSFAQARVDFKGLYSLTDSQRILVRSSLAKTYINQIQNLPLSLQYYAGGAHSVRGYGYQDIGPGKSFAVASAEFQQRIMGNFFLAAFYDIGSVSRHFFKELKRSPGVGIVYLTPIGDIELDVAFPLDRNPSTRKKHPRLQFSIGSEIFSLATKE